MGNLLKRYKGIYFAILKSGSTVRVEKIKNEWVMSVEYLNGKIERCDIFHTLKDAQETLLKNIENGDIQ